MEVPDKIEILRYKKRRKIIKYFMSLGMPRNMAEREAEWIKLANKMIRLRNGVSKMDKSEILDLLRAIQKSVDANKRHCCGNYMSMLQEDSDMLSRMIESVSEEMVDD